MNEPEPSSIWKQRRHVGLCALLMALCVAALLGSCSTGEVPKFEGLTARQWYEKGHDLWVEGRYVRARDAVTYFSRAIELDTDYMEAYNSRGIALDYLKMHVLAIEDFDEAIDLDENYKHAYNNRGIAHKKLGELEDALEDFDEAIGLDGNYKHAYNNRGNVYRMMERYERAIKDYDRALEIDPGFA